MFGRTTIRAIVAAGVAFAAFSTATPAGAAVAPPKKCAAEFSAYASAVAVRDSAQNQYDADKQTEANARAAYYADRSPENKAQLDEATANRVASRTDFEAKKATAADKYAAYKACLAGGAPAGTPITACNTTLSVPGSYVLANDLGPCGNPPGVRIIGDDITLYLNNHTITSDFAGVAVGPASGGGAYATQRAKVIGPGTLATDRGLGGLFAWAATGASIENVTAHGAGQGFYVKDSPNTRVKNSLGTGSIAIYLENSPSIVENSQCTGTNYGIYLYQSAGSTVTGNNCSNNAYYGIYDGSGGSTFTNNTATGNGAFDYYRASCTPSTLSGNTFGTMGSSC